jgi:rare lipoprotein A (peptidoglycan hydrolase)
MFTLMAALRVLLLTLWSSAPLVTETGLAAVYGYPGDRLAGGPLACTGKMLRSDEPVCAHRTLPCGTQLVIQSLRSQKFATCQVLDRGPYGARLPGGRFVIKKRPSGRGTWRGVVDMSPAVAGMLGVHTSEPVRIIYMKPGLKKAGTPKPGPKAGTTKPGKTALRERACEKRPGSTRVKRHAEQYRPRPRREALEQPLVSAVGARRGGAVGVFV